MRKLFASDLDGTLRRYDTEGGYRKQDLDAIRNFRNNGGIFGMCSGRSSVSLFAEIPMVETDFAIATSGSCITDGRGNILLRKTIDHEAAKQLYDIYKNEERFYVHSGGILYTFRKHKSSMKMTLLHSWDELPDTGIEGISITAGNNRRAAEITDYINRTYGNDVHAFQNNECVDNAKAGISKGTGLAAIRANFKADLTAGIGDSFNDIPLLEAADVAFALDFCDDRVKAHADHIVSGISEALDIFAMLK